MKATRRMSMNLSKKIEKELILEVILFSGGVASISLFYRNNLLLTLILLLAWMIGIKFWYKDHDIYFSLIGMVVGPLGEIVCVKFGAWTYSNPTFLGIPIWLPLAWALAVVLIKRIAETFLSIEIKPKENK